MAEDVPHLVTARVDAPEGEGYAWGEGVHDPAWGTRHGEWRFYYDDDALHSEVEYLDGQRTGLCRTWWRDGSPACEEWYEGGARNGPYRDWWDTGEERRKGLLRDDAYEGEWIFRNRDGTYHVGQCRAGDLHGPASYHLADGTLYRTGEWKDHKQTGEWTRFRADGRVEDVVAYEDGECREWTIFYEDGTRAFHGLYPTGPIVSWFRSGGIRREGYWRDHLLEGEERTYFASGRLRRRGSHSKGKRCGEWTWWNTAGDVNRQRDFGSSPATE